MTVCHPSDFTFDEHLFDTFSAISYLRRKRTAEEGDDRQLEEERWVHFVHRRAFRKLSG